MGTTALTKNKTKEVAKKASDTATKSINRTGDFVKKNPKTTLYVVGGLVGGYLLYRVVKGLITTTSSVFDPDIDNQVDVGDIDTSGATISIEQASIYAQQLLDAFNDKSPFWGTDEEKILEVFNRISPEDFRVIFNVFGNKDYNGYNSPPDNIFANLDSYEPRNLVYWLSEELSPNDGEVYTKVKQIVNDAGFAF